MRVAVVGAGVVGLATARELVVRGVEVDCYEAAGPMAARSVGDSRIFRLLHDRAELAELAVRSRQGWQEWSRAAGKPLVGSQGVVVSGAPAVGYHTATCDAGVEVELCEQLPAGCRLPARDPVGPFVLDRAGGVIDVRATGAFLLDQLGRRVVSRPVFAVESDGTAARVVTEDGALAYDAVVIAAGSGTPALAAGIGVTVPDRLKHHVRFAFRLDPALEPPCWIERSESWRPGFTCYSQPTGPRTWAIGAELPASDVAWELRVDEVARRSRETVTAYVREVLHGIDPTPIDQVYCDVPIPGGDGFDAVRVGPVIVVWGDNLFKFAPFLGGALAAAATGAEVPAELHQLP